MYEFMNVKKNLYFEIEGVDKKQCRKKSHGTDSKWDSPSPDIDWPIRAFLLWEKTNTESGWRVEKGKDVAASVREEDS
jgi:hypothetical protein